MSLGYNHSVWLQIVAYHIDKALIIVSRVSVILPKINIINKNGA